MQERYEQLLVHMDRHRPPAELLGIIMTRIGEERRRRKVVIRSACFGILSVAAVAALVPAWQEFYTEIGQTGFLKFASLLFSDVGAAVVYWKDFAVALAESFPVVGVAAVLASVFVLLFSLRFIVQDINIIMRRSKIARA
jgi:hypothetical protein